MAQRAINGVSAAVVVDKITWNHIHAYVNTLRQSSETYQSYAICLLLFVCNSTAHAGDFVSLLKGTLKTLSVVYILSRSL